MATNFPKSHWSRVYGYGGSMLSEKLLEILDYLIGMVIREVGVDAVKQTIIDRIEIGIARATADQVAAARFGREPPTGA